MTAEEIGKVWNDWITVRAYDYEDPCVGIHYAGNSCPGHEYLMPPDKARELAVLLMMAADALEGKE